MGKVRVIARVTPDEPDNFNALKEAVEALQPENIEIEDIGFGVRAIKLVKVVPEEDGAMPKFEEQLEKLPHSGGSEILAVDRM